MTLQIIIFLCGIGQLSVLIASSLVPFQLHWKEEFQKLSLLHRQMYVVYAGYTVLSIVAFAVISLTVSHEIVLRTLFARIFCAYLSVFWGIRLLLQPLLDVQPYLTTWWLRAGYHILTVLFLCFTLVYGYTAIAN